MKPIRIAAIGEIMVELSIGDNHKHQTQVNFAGDTANTAIYLKRLAGDGVQVAYVSVIGEDVLSDRIIEFLNAESLQTQLMGRHPTRPPGLYAITVDDTGERSFVYWRDNSAARTLFQKVMQNETVSVDEDAFSHLCDFDVVYFSGITLAILSAECRERLLNWLPEYRNKGGKVAFDSNYRPALWASHLDAQQAITRAWSVCDIALPSVDDEQALYADSSSEEVIKRLRSVGVRHGVLKRGSLGPVPIDPDVDLEPQAAATRIVDTTAAGDSFNGAYLAARLTGADEAEAIRSGHRCAVKVIGSRGAIVSLDDAG